MRIKECKEWDNLPIEVREILLENQKIINQHLKDLEDEKERVSGESTTKVKDMSRHPTSKFSKAKEKARVRPNANNE